MDYGKGSNKLDLKQDIDWERLDKKKFFFYGTGVFSAVAGALYPLQVIKTRQMAVDGIPPGAKGVAVTVRQIMAGDGVRGFYKGFGTVIFGTIPARVAFLSTLEITKASIKRELEDRGLGLSEASRVAVSSFVAGACASVSAQAVSVPIDVVSQRQMLLGTPTAASALQGVRQAIPALHPRANGVSMAMHIIRHEGVAGLYRGFLLSLATYTPNSAIWWSAYGAYKRWLGAWMEAAVAQREAGPIQMQSIPPGPTSHNNEGSPPSSKGAVQGQHQLAAQWSQGAAPSPGSAPPKEAGQVELLTVQTTAAILAGFTAAFLTNPLDVVKTRLQTAAHQDAHYHPTIRQTVARLLQEDGPRGAFRGLVPRMGNAALWGTCMVSAYEFLKRACAIED